MAMVTDAVLSTDRVYRYQLTRSWVADPRWIRFVMLNPSKADEVDDDPTIRRCVGFAKVWGYGGVVVHNLFALRATDPQELRTHPDPVGPGNARFLRGVWEPVAAVTVCAWGAHPLARGPGQAAVGLLAESSELVCLGLTNRGAPRHPLYLPGNAALRTYPG